MNRIGPKHNFFGRALGLSIRLPGIWTRRFVFPVPWWAPKVWPAIRPWVLAAVVGGAFLSLLIDWLIGMEPDE